MFALYRQCQKPSGKQTWQHPLAKLSTSKMNSRSLYIYITSLKMDRGPLWKAESEDFRTDLSEYLNFKHQIFKQVEFGTSGIIQSL